MAEAAMPGFDVRSADAEECSIGRRWTRVRNEGRERWKDVKLAGVGDNAARDDSIAIVGNPAGSFVEVAGVVGAVIEGEDGDEADFGSGDVKDVGEGEFVTRGNMKVDRASADGIDRGPFEAGDG